MNSLKNKSVQKKFSVKTEWDTGFTGLIQLKNKGQQLNNWSLEFTSPFEIAPDQIWGAEIFSHTDDRYILKPVHENRTIGAKKSTEIFFNANKIGGKIKQPQKIELFTSNTVNSNSPAKSSNHLSTNFKVKTEWDTGFTGVIQLKNQGQQLSNWSLEFTSPFEIASDQIWGAEIVSRIGDRYVLKPDSDNLTIGAHQSKEIFFNANKIGGKINPPSNIELLTLNAAVPVPSTQGSNQLTPNFSVQSEWDQGFTGIIKLENHGEQLNNWSLEFTSPFEIAADQIWGAEIVSRIGDRYTLEPANYNQTIKGKQSTEITFNANKVWGKIVQPQNFNVATQQPEITVEKDPIKLHQLFPDQVKDSFHVEDEWNGKFKARLDFHNVGEKVDNWTLDFISPYKIHSDQLWGAEIVSQKGEHYTLKPADYNRVLHTNQTASIYFTGVKMYGSFLRPQEVTFNNLKYPQQNTSASSPNSKLLPKSDKLTLSPTADLAADVDFSLIRDWGEGFEGAISITNNTGLNVDTWNLEFDFPYHIDNIWNAEIERKHNQTYSIDHARWNREIAAGETVTFNFTGKGDITSEPQDYELEGFLFANPSISKTIYTTKNPILDPELDINRRYQGRATFYDAANPAGGIGAAGFDVPPHNQLHKIVAINNLQWNGSGAGGAFLKVSGPKQRDGAKPIVVQVADRLIERADGMDMSAEAFQLIGEPIDGTVNIEYELFGPPDNYRTANGYRIGQGLVVETIDGTNPYYAATRLNNHRYPIESVTLLKNNGDRIDLVREIDNRFVMHGKYPIHGVHDLLVKDIFGQQLILEDINISDSSAPDTITGEQFSLI